MQTKTQLPSDAVMENATRILISQISDVLRKSLTANRVRQAVMRAEVAMRNVVPPFRWSEIGAPGRVERIEDSAALLGSFSADQQDDVPIGVVDEAVRDARAGGKRGEIAWFHSVNNAVYPAVDRTFDNVDELLFVFLGVRP